MQRCRLNIFVLVMLLMTSPGILGKENNSVVSISVPVPVDGENAPSDLTLSLIAQEIRAPLVTSIDGSAFQSDFAFGELMKINSENDYARFLALTGGEEENSATVFKQLVQLQNKDALFGNSTLLYKFFIGDDVSYAISSYFSGAERTLLFSFVKSDEAYLYQPHSGTQPIRSVLFNAVAEEEVLSEGLKYIHHEPKAGNSAVLVGGSHEVKVSYPDIWIADTKVSIQGNESPETKDGFSNITEHFGQLADLLSVNDIEGALNRLDDDSAKRFRTKDANIEELSRYMRGLLVPDVIVAVIDAPPFYIVYGTNFETKYRSWVESTNMVSRSREFQNLGLHPYFLVRREDDTIEATNIFAAGAVGRLLIDAKFLERVVLPLFLE